MRVKSSDTTPEVGPPGAWLTTRLRARIPLPPWREIVPVACVMLAWALLHRGFLRRTDVPLWDETAYLAAGWRLLHHASPQSLLPGSPLYEAWYALVHLVVWDPLAALYAQWLVVDLLLTVTIYAAIRASGAGPWLAYGASTYWSTLVFTWDVPRVGFFAVLLVLLAMLADHVGRRGWAALLLCAAALARPEYLLALGAWLAIRAWPRLTRKWRRRLLIGVPPVALVALVLIGPTRLGAGRSWLAFGQHYSLRWSARHPEVRLDPWSDWGVAMAADFPGVESLGQALVTHPGKVWRHVAENLLEYPGQLVELILSPMLPGMVVGPVLLIALLLGMAWSRKWSVPALRGCPLLLVAACASVLPSLLVKPKAVYALPVLLLLLHGLARGVSSLAPPVRTRYAALLGIALTSALWLTPPRPSRPLPVTATIADLRRSWSQQPSGTSWRMLEADGGWCTYVDPEGCTSLWLRDKPPATGFGNYVRAVDANAIVVSDVFRTSVTVSGDAELARFLDDPSRLGFRRLFSNPNHAFYLRAPPR